MNTPDPDCERVRAALERVRRDFPGWVITSDSGAPTWCRWSARRRIGLTLTERQHHRHDHLSAPTLDRLLAHLGAEQRAHDTLRHDHDL